ncbi:hypothetical protein [Actinocorallia aurantiaca]|uniref:hypothetical protein n=1 Tax=Actinocorallia aurantiaca TaxID=46204 RepID=UPI0031D037D2
MFRGWGAGAVAARWASSRTRARPRFSQSAPKTGLTASSSSVRNSTAEAGRLSASLARPCSTRERSGPGTSMTGIAALLCARFSAPIEVAGNSRRPVRHSTNTPVAA